MNIRLSLSGISTFTGLIATQFNMLLSIPLFVIGLNILFWGDLYKMLWITFGGILILTFSYFNVFKILMEIFELISV